MFSYIFINSSSWVVLNLFCQCKLSKFKFYTFTIIFTVIIGAVGLVPCVVFALKNIVKKNLPNVYAKRAEDFCLDYIPVYFGITALLYFVFSDSGIISNITAVKAKGPASLGEMILGGDLFIVTLMLISFVLFNLIYFVVLRRCVRKK